MYQKAKPLDRVRGSDEGFALLELGEGGAELVDGGVGDGLAHRLVDLLPHVRRQLVHGADGRSRSGSRSPGVRIFQHST